MKNPSLFQRKGAFNGRGPFIISLASKANTKRYQVVRGSYQMSAPGVKKGKAA
jgi:hypothetical protein